MIFQPVLPVFLILLLCAGVAGVAVWMLVRAPRAGGEVVTDRRALAVHRSLWALRLVMVLACAVMLLRPGLPGGSTQTLATDTDIVLVVDTTASIVAEDWDDGSPGSTVCAPTCARSWRSTPAPASPSSPRMRQPS